MQWIQCGFRGEKTPPLFESENSTNRNIIFIQKETLFINIFLTMEHNFIIHLLNALTLAHKQKANYNMCLYREKIDVLKLNFNLHKYVFFHDK